MKWLSTFKGIIIERRDPLGRHCYYVWENCRECLYDDCVSCGGFGGRYFRVADDAAVQLESRKWVSETP